MAIEIGRYNFEGPFQGTSSLEARSGVYAILTHNGMAYDPVDVGESAQVKTRVETHDRADCWRQHAAGPLAVAVLYTPGLQQAGRRAVEQELRQQFNWPCGDR
jgi:hypothetical protein